MKVKKFTFISAVFMGIVAMSACLWQNCVRNPIDLVIIVDGSGSVGSTRFDLFKEFIQSLVLKLNVEENGTKVALMQLSDRKNTRFEFGINNHSDVIKMLEAIENVKYQYGRLQETEIGLRMAETMVFNGENITDRSWAQNIVMLVAEGPSTYPVKNVLQEATHLKNSGVQLVAIGVGRKIQDLDFKDELYSLASDPQNVFLTSDDDILDVVENLERILCPNITVSSSVQRSTTKVSATPVIPVQVITSVLVKTLWITSYASVPAFCNSPTATSTVTSCYAEIQPTTTIAKLATVTDDKTKEIKKSRKKPSTKFSGKQLECFLCNYDEDVAKEFDIHCDRQKCTRDQAYCADAVLEHDGRRFVRKRCANSGFCNSTSEQCVEDFQHTADYTYCRVTCCSGKLCNPYSRGSYVIASVYIKFLAVFVWLLVTFIADTY